MITWWRRNVMFQLRYLKMREVSLLNYEVILYNEVLCVFNFSKSLNIWGWICVNLSILYFCLEVDDSPCGFLSDWWDIFSDTYIRQSKRHIYNEVNNLQVLWLSIWSILILSLIGWSQIYLWKLFLYSFEFYLFY